MKFVIQFRTFLRMKECAISQYAQMKCVAWERPWDPGIVVTLHKYHPRCRALSLLTRCSLRELVGEPGLVFLGLEPMSPGFQPSVLPAGATLASPS